MTTEGEENMNWRNVGGIATRGFGGLLATLSMSVAVAQAPNIQYSVLERISGPGGGLPQSDHLALSADSYPPDRPDYISVLFSLNKFYPPQAKLLSWQIEEVIDARTDVEALRRDTSGPSVFCNTSAFTQSARPDRETGEGAVVRPWAGTGTLQRRRRIRSRTAIDRSCGWP